LKSKPNKKSSLKNQQAGFCLDYVYIGYVLQKGQLIHQTTWSIIPEDKAPWYHHYENLKFY
jgi:hypothetical protein